MYCTRCCRSCKVWLARGVAHRMPYGERLDQVVKFSRTHPTLFSQWRRVPVRAENLSRQACYLSPSITNVRDHSVFPSVKHRYRCRLALHVLDPDIMSRRIDQYPGVVASAIMNFLYCLSILPSHALSRMYRQHSQLRYDLEPLCSSSDRAWNPPEAAESLEVQQSSR